MKSRCDNPKVPEYKNYGGRGISYDKSWSYFENFYRDMVGGYQENLTLDRIDNDGNYEPSNCRWATRTEQSNNTRRNRYITFKGRTLTINQWAREIGVKRSAVAQRFYVYKWPVEKCLKGGY